MVAVGLATDRLGGAGASLTRVITMVVVMVMVMVIVGRGGRDLRGLGHGGLTVPLEEE